MIYFDSDMSNSTNTVVYFDWKTVIYIYVCGICGTQFMLPMEKSVTFTSACANEIIPKWLLAPLLTKGKKEGMLEYENNIKSYYSVEHSNIHNTFRLPVQKGILSSNM